MVLQAQPVPQYQALPFAPVPDLNAPASMAELLMRELGANTRNFITSSVNARVAGQNQLAARLQHELGLKRLAEERRQFQLKEAPGGTIEKREIRLMEHEKALQSQKDSALMARLTKELDQKKELTLKEAKAALDRFDRTIQYYDRRDNRDLMHDAEMKRAELAARIEVARINGQSHVNVANINARSAERQILLGGVVQASHAAQESAEERAKENLVRAQQLKVELAEIKPGDPEGNAKRDAVLHKYVLFPEALLAAGFTPEQIQAAGARYEDRRTRADLLDSPLGHRIAEFWRTSGGLTRPMTGPNTTPVAQTRASNRLYASGGRDTRGIFGGELMDVEPHLLNPFTWQRPGKALRPHSFYLAEEALRGQPGLSPDQQHRLNRNTLGVNPAGANVPQPQPVPFQLRLQNQGGSLLNPPAARPPALPGYFPQPVPTGLLGPYGGTEGDLEGYMMQRWGGY